MREALLRLISVNALSVTPAQAFTVPEVGNDSNLLIVFYVQIMPDDFVMQLHRF
ncbi:ISSfl2 ORF [Shigella dysenteriae]|uniref:ISSfl2 ORF n=1 Tax=Shigella dysenteriae TaxID=622 RepID=A0A2X2ISL9_SHIDY|nr:ISSfl2 ORF [Shigella dysenteriae]